ncbi:hypothetical protein B0H14DRAFT_3561870, partial [Mycena olivaceomarginata]
EPARQRGLHVGQCGRCGCHREEADRAAARACVPSRALTRSTSTSKVVPGMRLSFIFPKSAQRSHDVRGGRRRCPAPRRPRRSSIGEKVSVSRFEIPRSTGSLPDAPDMEMLHVQNFRGRLSPPTTTSCDVVCDPPRPRRPSRSRPPSGLRPSLAPTSLAAALARATHLAYGRPPRAPLARGRLSPVPAWLALTSLALACPRIALARPRIARGRMARARPCPHRPCPHRPCPRRPRSQQYRAPTNPLPRAALARPCIARARKPLARDALARPRIARPPRRPFPHRPCPRPHRSGLHRRARIARGCSRPRPRRSRLPSPAPSTPRRSPPWLAPPISLGAALGTTRARAATDSAQSPCSPGHGDLARARSPWLALSSYHHVMRHGLCPVTPTPALARTTHLAHGRPPLAPLARGRLSPVPAWLTPRVARPRPRPHRSGLQRHPRWPGCIQGVHRPAKIGRLAFSPRSRFQVCRALHVPRCAISVRGCADTDCVGIAL